MLTFEREPVVLDAVRHVPPDHVLHVLQGLRRQRRVEARSLQTGERHEFVYST